MSISAARLSLARTLLPFGRPDIDPCQIRKVQHCPRVSSPPTAKREENVTTWSMLLIEVKIAIASYGLHAARCGGHHRVGRRMKAYGPDSFSPVAYGCCHEHTGQEVVGEFVVAKPYIARQATDTKKCTRSRALEKQSRATCISSTLPRASEARQVRAERWRRPRCRVLL